MGLRSPVGGEEREGTEEEAEGLLSFGWEERVPEEEPEWAWRWCDGP